MRSLELYKDVWVITLVDPAVSIHEACAVIGVFQSEEIANSRYEEMTNDDEKQEDVKFFVERAPMYLDVKVSEVMI